jgi:hypothetical protein
VLHDSRPWHHGPFYERRSHSLQSRSLFPLKNRHLSADDIGGLGGYYMGLLHYFLAEVEGNSKSHQPYPPPESRNHKSRPVFDRHILLPRCYQDRTNQPHLPPFQAHPGLWFLVGLGCLRLGYLDFVNRRSPVHPPRETYQATRSSTPVARDHRLAEPQRSTDHRVPWRRSVGPSSSHCLI